ncbi:hypothetical protein PR202_ga08082 [Eleusine coracana subsp. coracana]|uniref:Uncharacterized protein n=1 Tax=Eleusine coracana subsp. coracana TaxID=191504 RepID=A0AAV5BZD5_ELECO|nr:hypothetical protein PR202_ga08082 [Eleusine coracana subsp. coracana]
MAGGWAGDGHEGVGVGRVSVAAVVGGGSDGGSRRRWGQRSVAGASEWTSLAWWATDLAALAAGEGGGGRWRGRRSPENEVLGASKKNERKEMKFALYS